MTELSNETSAEYANALLPNYTPTKSVDIIRERLNGAKQLNDAIAEWIHERAEIEDRYAQDLEKLARKKLQIGNTKSAQLQEQVLGTFAQPWADIVSSVQANSQASSALAQKLKADIESPIRKYSSSNSQWGDVRQVHDGLMAIADKLDTKNSKKDSGAGSRLQETRSQWENQAPYAFGQFQKVDVARLVFLKDALTRYQTLESDRAQVGEKESEKVLNSILSFEPIEDIRSFSARIVSGDLETDKSFGNGHVGGPLRSSRQQQQPQHSTSNHNSHPPRHHTNDSLASDDSSSLYSSGTAGTNEGKKDTASGFHLRSKVGSIFRGGRKKKESGFKTPASIPENPSPVNHRGPPAPASRQATFDQPSSRGDIRRGPLVKTSGPNNSSADHPSALRPPPPPSRRANGPSSPSSEESEEFFGSAEPNQENAHPQGIRLNIRNEAIEENTAAEKDDDDVALSTLATNLRARSTISGRGSRGRRDIHSTLFTNIEPSEEEARSGYSNNRSTGPLISQLQSLGPQSTGPVSEHTSASFGSIPESPRQQIPSVNSVSAPSDAQSIRSLQSHASTLALAPPRHPELLQNPGLSGTVIELISTTVKDGVISSPTVTGEAAFGYRGEPVASGAAYLRFVNAGLDRVMPNPQFVQAISGGDFSNGTSTPGTTIFRINLENIYNKQYGAVGLKYSGPYGGVPVVFSPIWRVEKNQSSLMLTYKLSDEVASVIDHIVLQDLVITVPVEGGPAVAAQSKPPSTFNKEKQRIVWRFNSPFTVKKGSEERLLCRFTTAGSPCFEGSKGIDIKFKIYPAPTFQLEYLPIRNGNDPFKDDPTKSIENLTSNGESWIPVSTLGTLATGKYVAKAEANVQQRLE